MQNADIIFAILIVGIIVLLVIMLAYVLGEAHAVSLIQGMKQVFDTLYGIY